MKNNLLAALSICLITSALSAPALAAKGTGWEGWDRLTLNAGAFSADQSTTLRLDATDGSVGTRLDFEDNLGLDDRVTDPRIDGLWRYRNRSSVSFSYFEIDRDAVAPVTFTIRWGDIVIDPIVSPAVRTVYELKIIQGSWGYTWFRTPKWDVRATIGLFAMDIFASITDPGAQQKDEGDVLAPLPVYGLGFEYKLTGKWHLSGYARIFEIEADDYDGSLIDALFAATHHTFKNVGFGIGYNVMELDIDSEDEDFSGSLDIDYDGPFAYVNVRFGPGG